jgi:hypothetical protein
MMLVELVRNIDPAIDGNVNQIDLKNIYNALLYGKNSKINTNQTNVPINVLMQLKRHLRTLMTDELVTITIDWEGLLLELKISKKNNK